MDQNRVQKSLEASYTVPYEVINQKNKYFIITIAEGVNNTISINYLKPTVVAEMPTTENSNKTLLPQRSTPMYTNSNKETALKSTTKTKSGRYNLNYCYKCDIQKGSV